MPKRLLYLLICLALVALAVVGYDRVVRYHWVGDADLTVEFLVTDVETGLPIEGADIFVHSEGGFYEEDRVQDFRLKTDSDGVARSVCRRSMSFGTYSGLGFTRMYCVHLPHWFVGTVTPGHSEMSPVYIEKLQYPRAVERVAPRQAKLVVPITLRKSQP